MSKKLRIGVLGASLSSPWAAKSHIPALRASPDWELTAVCTTNPESAEAAKEAFGARLAFSDYNEMVASPDIDAVAVVLRVHRHHETTKAAIEAGKHVYTEWPLGRTTEEAEDLLSMARAHGVRTAVGLQSRVSPALLYMKDLLEDGYIGEMLSCGLTTVRHGALERPSTRNWQRDVTMGANPFTICSAHVIDAMRFVAGDITSIGGTVTRQVTEWYEPDTERTVEKTAPDTVMLTTRLANGAVASVYVTSVPWAPAGYRMEIYGTEGTLVVTGNITSQRGRPLRLQGARRSRELVDLPVPDDYAFVPADFPVGDPYNVGQLYTLFAQDIRTGDPALAFPTFETAVDMHHLLDAIRDVSEAGEIRAVDLAAASQ